MPYIGQKEIESEVVLDEKTPGGIPIIKVTYKDGLVEHFSELMHAVIVADEPCSLEVLRDKRVQPVVAIVLAALREWGVKLGELGYMSALLNKSLDYNRDTALQTLWSKWMPRPISVDDVDMLTIDRVLRENDAKV